MSKGQQRNTNIHPFVGTLLASGSVVGFHKESLQQQQQSAQSGKAPPLRAVNTGGCVFGKIILKAALASESAKQAISTLKPYQLALGSQDGIALLAHQAAACHLSGYLVGKEDVKDGFPSFDRGRLFEKMSQTSPNLDCILHLFYGVAALALCQVEGGHTETFTSENGTRIGCTLGSFGFDLAIHESLHKTAQAFPKFTIRAITDDIIPMIPPPKVKTHEHWQLLYKELASFRKTLQDNLKKDVGLALQLSKAGILLPSEAPDPDEDVLQLFPPNYFKRDGLVIGGAPIGTDPFISSFIDNCLAEAQLKLNTIVHLPSLEMPSTVQAAIQLLVSSGTKLLSWLTRVLPPKFTLKMADTFDRRIQACFLQILSPQNRPTPPECSSDRTNRALEKATLPSKHQGFGLTKLASTAAIQWWFSVAGALNDTWFSQHSKTFSVFTEDAYNSILHQLGNSASTQVINAGLYLPTSHRGLLSGFYPHRAKLKGKTSMSLILTHLAQDYAKLLWLQSCDPSKLSDTGTLTKSDIIISNSRSYAGLAVTAELSDPKNRIDNDDFIAWARYWLTLPQLPLAGNAQRFAGSDSDLEKCQSLHTDASKQFYLDNSDKSCSILPIS